MTLSHRRLPVCVGAGGSPRPNNPASFCPFFSCLRGDIPLRCFCFVFSLPLGFLLRRLFSPCAAPSFTAFFSTDAGLFFSRSLISSISLFVEATSALH